MAFIVRAGGVTLWNMKACIVRVGGVTLWNIEAFLVGVGRRYSLEYGGVSSLK